MADDFRDGAEFGKGGAITEFSHVNRGDSKYVARPGRVPIGRSKTFVHGVQVADPYAGSVSQVGTFSANDGDYIAVPLTLAYLVVSSGRVRVLARSASGYTYTLGDIDSDGSPYLVFGGSGNIVAQAMLNGTQYKWIKLFEEAPY